MFPKVKVCSEIVDSNNMRFMKFKAHDQFSLQISKREKVSHISLLMLKKAKKFSSILNKK